MDGQRRDQGCAGRGLARARVVAVLCAALSGSALASCDDGGVADDSPSSDVADVEACDAVREWDADARRFEERVVALINEERRRGGRCGDTTFPPLAALRVDPSLRCAARVHAVDMQASGYVGYANPDDPEALNTNQRLRLAGYPPATFVETVGAGWTSADDAVHEWLNNESHCWKFMTTELDQIGVGVYAAGPPLGAGEEGMDDVDYGTYWDLLIATPN
ncbi:MAG: CAP domain-containing protein [Myxococcales bacterium]|nr:CAP domain-containing protein [Myxococcales bacterium]